MANVTKVYKNWPAYDDDLANKAYVDSEVESLVNGDIEKLAKKVEKNTEDIDTAERNIINLNNTKLNTSVYDTFISEQYNPLVVKVDGKIESYYQSTDPSLNWLTSLEKNSHVGDIWYDTTTQKTFVYYKDTSTSPVTYFWQWQDVPIELIDSINGKAKIYSGVIPTNYVTGDYWLIPLNCYTNTYSLTSQSGEFSAGMIITIGPYEFVVDSVNIDNEIATYHANVPATSNYSLSHVYNDSNIELTVISTSQFVLPNNCYGGSICIAINNNTNYNYSDWINRNDYVPSDLASRYSLAEDVNEYVDSINNTMSGNYSTLDGKINNNYSTLDGKINNNYSTLDNKIDGNYNTLDSKAQDALDKADRVDDKYDEIINGPDGVKVSIQRLENRMVANIRGTGGNNLLKNSVGFRNKLYWKTINNSIIEQEYKTYAGQLITIFFRYKKGYNNSKITLGQYLNDVFVEKYIILNSSETVSEWTDVIFSYTSEINNPVIRFNSIFEGVQDNDAESNGASGSKLVFSNGLIITDLMIGYGEKQPWTPYYNEVYGKTYNLDEHGLDIRENSSDKSSHIDANSLDFNDSEGNVESVFSKAETITDNIYANNSINIGNLNIVRIDDNNILEY